MYPYQLFDHIKGEVQKYYQQSGNKIIENLANNLFGKMRNEGFTANEAWRAIAGGFACVASNDAKISYDELRAYNAMVGEPISYSDFFNIMSKYNKQENRNNTIELFNRMRSGDTAYNFITFCIAVCIVDGNLATREETFCTSLCDVYINRFGR